MATVEITPVELLALKKLARINLRVVKAMTDLADLAEKTELFVLAVTLVEVISRAETASENDGAEERP